MIQQYHNMWWGKVGLTLQWCSFEHKLISKSHTKRSQITPGATYLVEDLLQVGSSHTICHMSVSRMGKKELALSCQRCSDVLLTINILLAPVHNSNVAYGWTASNISFSYTLLIWGPSIKSENKTATARSLIVMAI